MRSQPDCLITACTDFLHVEARFDPDNAVRADDKDGTALVSIYVPTLMSLVLQYL